MKLNKIKRICKEGKAVFIMEQKYPAGGICQWIGDGGLPPGAARHIRRSGAVHRFCRLEAVKKVHKQGA